MGRHARHRKKEDRKTGNRQFGAACWGETRNLTGIAVCMDACVYFSWVDRLVKVCDRLVPTAVTPVMITTAIRAAIRPYSMAVAPDSSLQKFSKILRMRVSLVEIAPTVPARICERLTAITKNPIFPICLHF